LYGKGEKFLHAFFVEARECKVIDLEGNHSGHVQYLVRVVNS
jgi:hypothetical protein